jgi:aspartyl-tRNA(Asn)/glutamyl-tRNA(Gln) amidotransferase subunit A
VSPSRGSAAGPLWQCSIVELAGLLRARSVSAVDVAQALLERIAAVDASLRAFITVNAELTLRQAREAQAAFDRGEDAGFLQGIPVSLKDAIDTADLRTTFGAGAFANRAPGQDAHVTRSLRAGGAVLLGKTNLLEFCWGPTDAHAFGQTANPWDLRYSPGGSSSGGGVAVAAGMGPASIGTDTGGSVRNPAAFCGVVGLKPTFGVIGRSGVFPLSFTLDHVGVLSRRVEDAAVVLSALVGPDPQDPQQRVAVVDYLREARTDAPRPTLLVPRAHFWEHLDDEVATRAEEAIATLAGLGFAIHDITLAHAEAARAAVQNIILAEAAWYHSRLVAETPDGISHAFRARIAQGAVLPATAYADALDARRRFRAAVAQALDGGALLLTPASPYPPFPLDDPMATGRGAPTRVIGQCTGPFNVAGTPCIVVPCGFTRAGLPVGIQFVGLWHHEPALLRAALAYERTTGWWQRRPVLGTAAA